MSKQSPYFIRQHPSIYQVSTDASGVKTYNRVNDLETSPYYRWDTTLLPAVEAFPPGFRMIAYSDNNLLVECCNIVGGEESCTEQDGNLNFPNQNCDFVGIAFCKNQISCLFARSMYEHTNIPVTNHHRLLLQQCPPAGTGTLESTTITSATWRTQ